MKNWYKIDYNKLSVLLLPIRFRQPIIKAILRAFMLPIIKLKREFDTYKSNTDYILNHNSQVCYLQAVLNDNFDPVERRIYITDAPNFEIEKFLWIESEDKPVMLYDDSFFMLHSENFIGANGINFTVNVPSVLSLETGDLSRMRSLLNYYKLASMRYNIQEF